jgi:hypothetical protein
MREISRTILLYVDNVMDVPEIAGYLEIGRLMERSA